MQKLLLMTLLFTFSITAVAQSCELEDDVKIGFQAKTCAFWDYSITLNGVAATGFGNGCLSFALFPNLTNKAWTHLKVDKTYTVTAGTQLCITDINFEVPKGYVMYIDGIESKTIFKTDGGVQGTGDGQWDVVVRKECSGGKEGSGRSSSASGSVVWETSLGYLRDGRSAERISIQEKQLTAAIYTPAALIYSKPAQTSDVDVVKNADGSLRQVKAPQTLADIVVISPTEYEVHYYDPADVGAKSNGIYQLSGQPFVKWNVKNPTPGSFNKLEITKIEAGQPTDKSEYTWDAAVDTWTLRTGWSAGAFARTEKKVVTYPSSTSRTETTIVSGSDGVVSQKSKTYLNYPWGEELVQEVSDPEGAALTTTYTYYEKPTETHRYQKLQTVVYADGSWEKYDYDVYWNISKIIRPWKDLSLATATENNSQVTLYGYTNSDNGVFGLSGFVRIPWDEEEKINGITVRKSRYLRSVAGTDPDMISVTDSSYSGSDNGEAVNLIGETVTTSYRFSAPEFLANRIAAVVHGNGRKDTYTYERGNYVPNADPSLTAFVPDVNGLAERQTVVHGTTAAPNGVAFKTTKETMVRDQLGNDVLRETYVYNGSDYERIGWTVNDYDNRGHLTMTRNHKGELATAVWTGEFKMSEIDTAGMETVYEYDALSRIRKQTKKGIPFGRGFLQPDIVTTFEYDAEGQITSEKIEGVDGLSLTALRFYDRAGRLTKQKDPAGLSTVYSYANGGRTQTLTRPGGAAKVIDKYLDGQTKSITGAAIVARYFDYGVNSDGTRYTQEFTGPAGLSSPRWTKTSIDWMNREIAVESPSFTGTNVILTSIYNTLGQLQKQTTTANAAKLVADKLFEYDELGRESRSGSDIDNSGSLTLISTDRLRETEHVYEKVGSDWFRVITSKTYLMDNNGTPVMQAERERLNNFALNGADQTISEVTTTDVAGNNTKITTTIDREAKKRITTKDIPDSILDAVSSSRNGLLQSATGSTPQTAATYHYDSLGRPIIVTYTQAGTRSQTFNTTTGRLATTFDGVGTSTYEYYPDTHVNAGRVKSIANDVSKKVYFTYNSRGETVQTWGDTTYPLEYVYDGYGQQTELRRFRAGQNWSASAWPSSTTGTADIMKWIYQESTGLVTQKQDAVLKGPTYTYDEMGRTQTRVWARGITCTYGYDANTGELRTVTYSDGTPAVSLTYDRGGRESNVTDAAGSRTRTFTAAGQLQTEQIAGGILDGVGITVGYDAFLRRNSLQTTHGANTLSDQTYDYDIVSRLETVTSGSQTATYAYHPNSGLLNTTSFTGGTNIARSYDSIGRLENITTTPAAAAAQSYAYTYNNLNQRTRTTREDGSYWSYIYNDRGELTSGKKYWSDNSIVWGTQTEYNFDNIGNRNVAKNGGNQLGSLRQSNYTTNSLNQYTQRTVPGAVDVTGTANMAATVTVNGGATARKGEYFYKEMSVDNSNSADNTQLNVVGARNNFGAGGEDAVTQKGGRAFVPRSPEVFTYDDDGNLTSDGRWNYTWDGDNRLVSMEALTNLPPEAKQRLEFSYDFGGRRIQKKIYIWNIQTSSYQLQSVRKFISDEWNIIVELDGNNAPVKSFAWGQDVSGTLHGAGGVGGLLLINEGGQTYQAGYDGGGNLTSLINAGTGQISASYEYDPFGNTLKSTGEYAENNPYRFSTKYEDSETGLLYYGYRYYQPQTGRWLSRDPLEEEGGANLYAFVGNDPINQIDLFGLYDEDVHYYLTYYLARQTGCFDKQQARWIAEGAQTVDEEAGLKPGIGVTPAQARANAIYHALTPEKNHAENLRNLMEPALKGVNRDRCGGGQKFRHEQLTAFGRYIHYFQDKFSHYGWDDPILGHGPRGHWPDQPWRKENIDRAKDMARQTYKKMREYAKMLKCCEASPSDHGNVQWDKVDTFLSIPYGSFLEGMDDKTLEEKRKTLTDHTDRRPIPKRLGKP